MNGYANRVTVWRRSCFAGLLCLGFAVSASALETRRNSLGMTFVRVPAGEFIMGTGAADARAVVREMDAPDPQKIRDEAPAHTVVIGEAFWLQQTEVTQAQWLQVMGNRPGPAEHWQRAGWGDLPVISVSWHMAQRFVEELNRVDGMFRYRLPREAEWEYAARAGSDGIRPYPSDRLTAHAWFIQNSGDVPHPVATRQPNAFGLYDMLGNAWEWVEDRYAADIYTATRRIDPEGPEQGPLRVRRGGSYHCPLWQTRPAYRAADTPRTAYSVIGFRVAAEEKP